MWQFRNDLFKYYEPSGQEDQSDNSINYKLIFYKIIVIVVLFVPIINLIFVLSYFCIDRYEVLASIALNYRMKLKDEYK